MPGKVGVKIKAGRNLPIMDRTNDTTDAYVEIKLGSVTQKTDVCRKSLNPLWNTDWFRFEVDDAELQDEPLQIRLMDHDTYSANDAIGKVNIGLNPLCLESVSAGTHAKGTVLSGWIPVFDTMHGIRGEVNIIVKVDLFSDVNKFRQSSCGIPFFHSQCVPYGYRAQVIHGFVEELVVNDDPEYQWIDKIRTPRASNEARQVVFLKLSGQVQRKMGLKAINMGANAVIGYTQCFDLEGDVGVVARGIGTAVTLTKDINSQLLTTDATLIEERTLKYLEFLTGANLNLPMQPEYTLQIQKSHSSTDFELERFSSEFDEAEFLADLLRQESACVKEKSPLNLKHHMRRITNSSLCLLNEKYNQFLRRNEIRSPERTSRSLSSLYTNISSKTSSPKNSADDFPQKTKMQQLLPSPNKMTHVIIRSISDDSAMKRNNALITGALNAIREDVGGQTAYQTTTQSSPSLNNRFQFIQSPETQKRLQGFDDADGQANPDSSSGTVSLVVSASDSYNSDRYDNSAKVSRYSLSRSKSINPNAKEHATAYERHSLLSTFKEFSQHLQALLHRNSHKKHQTQSQNKCFAKLNLSTELKSYYSSEPEYLANLESPIIRAKQPVFCKYASMPNIKLSLTNSRMQLPLSSKRCIQPILQICPSTPTPSESDNSQMSPCDWLLANATKLNSMCDDVAYTPLTESMSCDSFINSNSPNIPNYKQHICTNISNTSSSSSLLAPCITFTPLTTNEHTHKLDMCRHTSTCHTNRSSEYQMSSTLNNGTSHGGGTTLPCVTDSPSMKRFGSPASAAVVAASISGKISDHDCLSPPSPTRMGVSATPSDSASTTTSASTATTIVPKEVSEIGRRSSDSDLSITPKGNSICVASERLVAATALMRLNQPLSAKATNTTDGGIDMLEYPFLTMSKYPIGFILHIGATVAARSVKLLERVPNPDEPEIRDSWWTELRMEIRSHARALGCNVVLGYAESTTISDDVCVLSATGTAAVINMAYNRSISQNDIFSMSKPACGSGGSLEEHMPGSEQQTNKDFTTTSLSGMQQGSSNSSASQKKFGGTGLNILKNTCNVCHIPYNVTSMPFNAKMRKCGVCRKGRVPDVLLATLEVPDHMQVTGRGCFLQAQVVRAKKDLRSELNAKEISDGLPFLEYELHRVLINKLKAKGMNAIFGLKTQVAIGERMISLIATGTAIFLTALPMPQVPKIVAGNSWTDKQKLNELQKKLQETFEKNQEIYQLKPIDPDFTQQQDKQQSDTDDSDEEVIEIDLNCGNKDTCVLEVDDIEDLEIISLLMEPYPPEGFHVVNTQSVPGMEMEVAKNLQMFTQIWRARLDVGHNVNGFQKHFQRLLQTIYFKLRTMIPCAICDLRFRLDLPESDQIQLLVTGMALGLGDINKFKYRRKTVNSNSVGSDMTNLTHNSTMPATDLNGLSSGNKRSLQDEDYIFPLDEDNVVDTPTPTSNLPPFGSHSLKLRKTSPSRLNTKQASSFLEKRLLTMRDRHGVDISPLSFIPGARIEKYLGNLNFFFIRESTSIRENGGISGFLHGFITELLAVVRAHIAALGGNAMVSFYMTELILVDNQHKNQGQCLISIGGDAVLVAYNTDDQ